MRPAVGWAEGRRLLRMANCREKRKLTLSLLKPWLLIFALLVGAQSALPSEPRPNILLIMAEDMSPRVGAFGDEVAVTPRLDALAERSVLYPNTFTTAGVCAPSLAAQILGQHQIATGAQHMRTASFREADYRAVPPAEVKAYPELLRREGYYTFVTRKLDYQFSDVALGSGPFSLWDHEGRQSNWHGREEGQPFFGFISLNETHESKLFPNETRTEPSQTTDLRGVDSSQVTVPPYYPDHPVIRSDLAQHYKNIETMDARVGAILDQLEADGLADTTIVIWTTDHGDGLPRAKRELYDSGIKVPLLVHWPEGFKPKGTSSEGVDERLVSFVDIGPSVLQMAGLKTPDFMHGTPQLAQTDEAERQYIYASKDRIDQALFRERAVRDHQYKYIQNLTPGKPGAARLAYRDRMPMMQELWRQHSAGTLNAAQAQWFAPRPSEEFYDVIADPHEIHNLAGDPKQAASQARLKKALTTFRASLPDFSDTPEREMADIFWPQGVQPITGVPRFDTQATDRMALIPAAAHDSIGYRINGGPWRLYVTPLALETGTRIEAKSIRYGWAESPTVVFTQD